jgi:hypothetical protein
MKLIDSRSEQTFYYEQNPKAIPYYLGHIFIYLGCVIAILAIGWLILQTIRLFSAYQVADQRVTNLDIQLAVARVNPTSPDLLLIQENLQGMSTDLGTLYEEATPFLPLTPYLGWVPGYGGDIKASPYLLTAGRDMTQGSIIAINALSPTLKLLLETGADNSIAAAATTLTAAKPDLAQAEAFFQRAKINIEQIDTTHLTPGLAYRVTQLQGFLPKTVAGLQFAQRLPTLLGTESPQTYLILAQNSDELRPSGGYINAAGYIVVDQGQIAQLVMQDSYAVDQLSNEYPYPPEPIRQYMGADYWVFRDAGWSPDFPTTARTALDLYKLGQGISASGVIAFDQRALPDLLRAFEPISVEGEQVTGQNVIKLMQEQWAPDPGEKFNREWFAQRKTFMITLAQTVRQKFEQNPGSIKLSELIAGLQKTTAEKHLLFYLTDPAAANFLTEVDWSGALHPTEGDYLMAVDANIGFNKASGVVAQQLNYQVTLARDGSAEVHANLVYQHQAPVQLETCELDFRYAPTYEQNMYRCYWNYMRLIVPATAQLISGPSNVVEGQYLIRGQSSSAEIDVEPLEPGKVSWGQLFLLAPQNSLTLDYIYTLPPNTARFVTDHWEYNLYIQKQPGADRTTAQVKVTLPEGAQLLATQPLAQGLEGTVITYDVSSKTDQEIDISYILP